MFAEVKLKGIDAAITVEDVTAIKTEDFRNSQVNEITDFKSFTFFKHKTMNYIFVGKTILHVDGDAIEYVLFR